MVQPLYRRTTAEIARDHCQQAGRPYFSQFPYHMPLPKNAKGPAPLATSVAEK